VVRIFPRTPRRRVIAALAASSLLCSAAIPLAAADELRDRKERVDGNISKTRKDLDQSSADLVAATRALGAARTRLADARRNLAQTRGELAAATVLDRRMQAALEQAVGRLASARRELAASEADMATQERVLGQVAVANYQQGDPDLLGLSMLLTSQDTAELTSQLNSVRSLLDKEAMRLDRLDATRVMLTVKEEEVAAAKREVAAKRREAAANLARKQELEAQAEEAAKAVRGLVGERAVARSAAAAARQKDLKMLRGLQQERDRISDLLAKRAEAARRRAEAAARAAREKAAAEKRAAQREAQREAQPAPVLGYPVDGYITSSYGMRLHPVYKEWTLHDGTDFGASCGTPVRASASGRVIAVYYNSAYGNRVIMDNGYHRGVGLGTAYNHLSSYSTYAGQQVQRGEVIGYVGNTGYSTGCHLHFMVFENGATVDPMSWLGEDE
jgi:murein DD-endopeptidase MepM/ murein hydrolase activator NlpD